MSKARWIAADMICTGRQATREEANQTPHFSKNLKVRCYHYMECRLQTYQIPKQCQKEEKEECDK